MTDKRTDSERLDAVVVILALLIVGGVAAALVFARIPDNQLAVLASIASGILGTVVGSYAGYRWATSKQASETIADMARASVGPSEVQVINPPSDPVNTTSEEK